MYEGNFDMWLICRWFQVMKGSRVDYDLIQGNKNGKTKCSRIFVHQPGRPAGQTAPDATLASGLASGPEEALQQQPPQGVCLPLLIWLFTLVQVFVQWLHDLVNVFRSQQKGRQEERCQEAGSRASARASQEDSSVH